MAKAKILVIDNDPDFREAISVISKSAAYDVLTANNIKDGEEKILSEKPNLIILDIIMDSIFDGFSLCNEVKTGNKFKERKDTPIIFVSAVKDMTGSRFAFKRSEQGFVGPDDYIDKPVKPDDLLTRIDKLLKK